MIKRRIFQPGSAEPAAGQIQVYFFALTALGADAKAVAKDKHADHQFGINSRSSGMVIIKNRVFQGLVCAGFFNTIGQNRTLM